MLPVTPKSWVGQLHLGPTPAEAMEPGSSWLAQSLGAVGSTERRLPGRMVSSVHPGEELQQEGEGCWITQGKDAGSGPWARV